MPLNRSLRGLYLSVDASWFDLIEGALLREFDKVSLTQVHSLEDFIYNTKHNKFNILITNYTLNKYTNINT